MAKSSDPFASDSKPYISAAPGTDARKDPGAIRKMSAPPASSGHLGRLAQAIARLPNVPSSRGNASNLFLP